MINKAILIGNLGADPEMRYTQNGTPVVSFTMATTERYKNKDGEQVENTEWHKITAWQRLAEICGEYLSKGSRVYIEGKLQTRKWQDQDGNDRYTTEIVAREMKMLSPKSEGGQGGGQQQDRPQNNPPAPPEQDPFDSNAPTGGDVPF